MYWKPTLILMLAAAGGMVQTIIAPLWVCMLAGYPFYFFSCCLLFKYFEPVSNGRKKQVKK